MATTSTTATPSNPGGSSSSTVAVPQSTGSKLQFGNFLRPFSAKSLWNCKPIKPKFSTFEIPLSDYFPVVASGEYSTGVFEAKATDKPMVIYPNIKKTGVWCPDSEISKPTVTIPRWPNDAQPATGGDGHCDIVDSVTGVVHSFWQLRKVADKWTAVQYAWTRIDGTGWGSPSHYFQGARAAAVPPIGGLIRKHEINDGKDSYSHVLAMSLTFNALCPAPAYVYPATSADQYAASLNSGKIPEGALVMLPPDFDTSKITSEKLRKVVNTLKTYGAYVVDQNSGTPFYIYVENDSGYALHGMAWNSVVANELQIVRSALRMVESVEGYVDGNGIVLPKEINQNVLSMRGPWTHQKGTVKAEYDTWTQCVKFPASNDVTTSYDSNGRGISKVTWAKIVPGDTVKLTSIATGGAKLLLQVWSGSAMAFQVGPLANGESKTFKIPTGAWYVLYLYSGGKGVESTVAGTLVKV
jgi:hypothetical protein